MNLNAAQEIAETDKTAPLCPVFGECGGCSHQDLSYAKELQIKEERLHSLFKLKLGIGSEVFDPIVASPKDYHYRHRLDLTVKRSRGEVLFGFQSSITRNVVSVDTCPIAMKAVADFIPRLREEAFAKLPSKYRTANLVVRTGDDGRVKWGGIGRHSLVMREADYFWTEIESKKIYYSLENFFQANLSILPRVIEKIRSLVKFDKDTLFLDLYSGVGLFGLCFADETAQVIMVEDCPGSVHLAKYNVAQRNLENVQIYSGKMEDQLGLVRDSGFKRAVAMIDPPRAGLSPQVSETLSQAKSLESLLYLSCHPDSLVRDLAVFLEKGWRIEKTVPFDFFPRTSHLETFVLLKPGA